MYQFLVHSDFFVMRTHGRVGHVPLSARPGSGGSGREALRGKQTPAHRGGRGREGQAMAVTGTQEGRVLDLAISGEVDHHRAGEIMADMDR